MIECTNGGPLDGDLMDGTGAEQLFIPVKYTLPVAIRAETGEDRPRGKEAVHVYLLRRLIEGSVYEYMGEVWR